MRERRTPQFGLAASGFTFVELVLGMAVTTMALAAMAALMSAVSAGWKQQGAGQSTHLANRQAVARVDALLRPAKLTGFVREGSLSSNTADAACVLFWRGDFAGGTADRDIEFSEIALLEHDRPRKEIRYYQVVFPPNLSASQTAAADRKYKHLDLLGATAASDFKALNYVVGRTVATGVTGATFYVNWPTGNAQQLPSVEYQLVFDRGGTPSQAYGATTLRSPDLRPTTN